MKCTFLGTGTSYGIPVIGCTCEVCTSSDPRNKRRRSSLYLEAEGFHLIIDTPPDFREQALTFGVKRVDAVCLTHAHADHVCGFDDLRVFSYQQKMEIPVFASGETIESMKKLFYYVFEKTAKETFVPQVSFKTVEAPFEVGPFSILPLPVRHGANKVYGYLLRAGGKSIGYVPDCKFMPDAVFDMLVNLDIMILDATRTMPHPTHLSLSESIEHMKKIGARSSYIAHLCHDMDHEQTQSNLPDSFYVPYDGLKINF